MKDEIETPGIETEVNPPPAPPTRRVPVARRKLIGLIRLAALTAKLKEVFGISISPLGQQAKIKLLMKAGKMRGYRTRRELHDANGNRISYRAARLQFIRASQLQGIEIAKKRRQAYVQRRTMGL